MRFALVGLLVAIAMTVVILVGESRADLESSVFTSKPDHLRLVVPRGWVATEQPSYPGLLLSMMRDQPEGKMMLTAESFTRDLYCSWPVACRTSRDPLPTKFACALRSKLAQDRKLHVGPIQAGPKENDDAGMSSVWFEYDDGKRFVRQAVALTGDRAISLLVTAPTSEARGSHGRAFEQALRTMSVIVDDIPVDAGVVATDAAVIDAGAMFESAPAPKINPVGVCP